MTQLNPQAQAFINTNRSAAMVTLRADGTPHAVRIGVALVDGRLWSSSTQNRVRTRHLRRDPRSTLFIFDSTFRWLSLECAVTILDGDYVTESRLLLASEVWRGDQRLFDVAALAGREHLANPLTLE